MNNLKTNISAGITGSFHWKVVDPDGKVVNEGEKRNFIFDDAFTDGSGTSKNKPLSLFFENNTSMVFDTAYSTVDETISLEGSISRLILAPGDLTFSGNTITSVNPVFNFYSKTGSPDNSLSTTNRRYFHVDGDTSHQYDCYIIGRTSANEVVVNKNFGSTPITLSGQSIYLSKPQNSLIDFTDNNPNMSSVFQRDTTGREIEQYISSSGSLSLRVKNVFTQPFAIDAYVNRFRIVEGSITVAMVDLPETIAMTTGQNLVVTYTMELINVSPWFTGTDSGLGVNKKYGWQSGSNESGGITQAKIDGVDKGAIKARIKATDDSPTLDTLDSWVTISETSLLGLFNMNKIFDMFKYGFFVEVPTSGAIFTGTIEDKFPWESFDENEIIKRRLKLVTITSRDVVEENSVLDWVDYSQGIIEFEQGLQILLPSGHGIPEELPVGKGIRMDIEWEFTRIFEV